MYPASGLPDPAPRTAQPTRSRWPCSPDRGNVSFQARGSRSVSLNSIDNLQVSSDLSQGLQRSYSREEVLGQVDPRRCQGHNPHIFGGRIAKRHTCVRLCARHWHLLRPWCRPAPHRHSSHIQSDIDANMKMRRVRVRIGDSSLHKGVPGKSSMGRRDPARHR